MPSGVGGEARIFIIYRNHIARERTHKDPRKIPGRADKLEGTNTWGGLIDRKHTRRLAVDP